MTDTETAVALGGISAAVVALGHEWLHSSDITADLPELGILASGSGIGSVSVGLAILTFGGVLLNYWVYEDD